MILNKMIQDMGLELVNSEIDTDIDIANGYASDLLSQVLSKAKSGAIWLTIQSHMNIIGVASMTGIKAIVVCEGHDVPSEVVGSATAEGIAILKTGEGAFSLSGKLYERGVR